MRAINNLKNATLLHDIGKLGYLAGENGNNEEIETNFLEEYRDLLPSEVINIISLHYEVPYEKFSTKEYI